MVRCTSRGAAQPVRCPRSAAQTIASGRRAARLDGFSCRRMWRCPRGGGISSSLQCACADRWRSTDGRRARAGNPSTSSDGRGTTGPPRPCWIPPKRWSGRPPSSPRGAPCSRITVSSLCALAGEAIVPKPSPANARAAATPGLAPLPPGPASAPGVRPRGPGLSERRRPTADPRRGHRAVCGAPAPGGTRPCRRVAPSPPPDPSRNATRAAVMPSAHRCDGRIPGPPRRFPGALADPSVATLWCRHHARGVAGRTGRGGGD
jgi:hypothetical protein